MPLPAANMSAEWEGFFQSLEAVTKAGINRRSPVYKLLIPVLEECISRVRPAARELHNVWAGPNEPDDQLAEWLIAHEMRFFIALAEPWTAQTGSGPTQSATAPGPSGDDETLADVLGAGKTIKDSIEKYLEKRKKKLPGWLDKVLNVLNEILSIVKGGS